jgi:hypothetical protein
MRGLVIAGWLVVGTLGVVSTAWGQHGDVDVSAGYLNVSRSMHGANAQLTGGFTQRWSGVLEVDWSTGNDCPECVGRYRDLGVLGGVRHRWKPTPSVEPFWQLQVGALRSTSDAPSFTATYFAFQPGAGVTVMASNRVGFRAQADLQLAGAPESDALSASPRITIGAVVRLGR